jgi:hypothetical protein
MDECYCACNGTKWKHKHVPIHGEFLVRDGKIFPILELSTRDHTEEHWEYEVYTEVDENGDEVEL